MRCSEWIVRGLSKGTLGCALWAAACTGSESGAHAGASGAEADAASDGPADHSGGASGATSGGAGTGGAGSGGSPGGSSGSSAGVGASTGGSSIPDPGTIRACTARRADPACGGDLIGFWNAHAYCVDLASAMLSGCREHFFSGKRGSLTLNADGTYRYDDQSLGGYVLLVCDTAPPPSCDNLSDPCPEDPSGYCPCPTAPTGVCACPGATISPMRTTTGTWTLDPVTQKLLLSENFGPVGGFSYCAQNNELTLNISGQIYTFSR